MKMKNKIINYLIGFLNRLKTPAFNKKQEMLKAIGQTFNFGSEEELLKQLKERPKLRCKNKKCELYSGFYVWKDQESLYIDGKKKCTQ